MSSRPTVLLLAGLGLSAACVSVQDYAGEVPPALAAPDGGAQAGPTPPLGPAETSVWGWDWANPAPTGKTLFAINGTSERDLWVGGEGILAHWNGEAWDKRRIEHNGIAYFAIGARSPTDVWAAGTLGNETRVLHYDGKEWTESYPFAGGAFGGFSHGAGSRLFAILDLGVLELGADGVWRSALGPTIGGVFSDIWVSKSGDAWGITSIGARLMHLRPGQEHWEMEGPELQKNATGLAISGAGEEACAFYTGAAAPEGVGFLRFDGTSWSKGKGRSSSPPWNGHSDGARSACLFDGTGFLLDAQLILRASLTSSPSTAGTGGYGIPKWGAWSGDGAFAYAVGERGVFIERESGIGEDADWQDKGPTIRNDLYDVDVGLDGAVFAVDALMTDRSRGGEVLSWRDAWRRPDEKKRGPSMPIAVTALAADSAWVASNERGHVAVTRWNGAWDKTEALAGRGAPSEEARAIWAASKDDVWVTGSEICPDPTPGPTCSKPLAGFAARFDGASWTMYPTPGVYRAVHGPSPDDVWFAGDGVAHWDGRALTPVSALEGSFEGLWASEKGRVWLWGDDAVLFDGTKTTPIGEVLHTAADWHVTAVAESAAGDVFVLTTRAAGTSILWFDPSRTRLVEQIASDMSLKALRGRGNQLWAVGQYGATLRFVPPSPH